MTFFSFCYLVRIVINVSKISTVRNQQHCDDLKQILNKEISLLYYDPCLLFHIHTNSLCLYSRGFHWKTLVPGPLCNVNTDLIQHYRLLTGRKIIRTVWSRSLANAKPIVVVRMFTGNKMPNRKTDKALFKTVAPGKRSLKMVLKSPPSSPKLKPYRKRVWS